MAKREITPEEKAIKKLGRERKAIFDKLDNAYRNPLIGNAEVILKERLKKINKEIIKLEEVLEAK